ncbi:MAG: phage/plasmid primase, P4 family [Victivallaceae bacterium]
MNNHNRPDRQVMIEVQDLLAKIPADLPYPDWFRVAAAIKNEGGAFEIFDRWSRTAPGKYDAAVAKRTWDGAAAEGKDRIGIGTLRMLASRYGAAINAPSEMLPPPDGIPAMAQQAAAFIDHMFVPGEYFELVLETAERNGRIAPVRSSIVERHDETEQDEAILARLQAEIDRAPHGAWISLNPLREKIAGKAPSDADVTEYRYALIEADDLSQEEQWAMIRALNLPVKAVVWSGGKSLHVIAKIEAGNNRELYNQRINMLYEYLDNQKYPYDRANRNPSRLTRLPGFYRDGSPQYVVATEFGPQSWNDFERMITPKAEIVPVRDQRAVTSPFNGRLGGRPSMPVTEFAQMFVEKHSQDGVGCLRYWRGTWWQFNARTWIEISDSDLEMLVTGFLQRMGAHAQGRLGCAAIKDVIANLKSDNMCGLQSTIAMPCFLPGGNGDGYVMNFNNGLVDLDKYLADPNAASIMQAHTPRFFSRHSVDYDFDPTAQCPQWMAYLETTFNDPELRTTMQLLFGYILSGWTCFNIGFFWIGRGGDGKSVAAHILRKLVGESNFCCLSFGDLGDRFSSHLLTEHSLNLVEELPVNSEMRNISDCEKVFKMVTDGAVIAVERKFKEPYSAPATARCVFLANELPAFVDRSNGLWDRLVIIPFNNRFRDTDAEKPNLKYELEQELPGIFNWALHGIQMLREHTRFPLPDSIRRLRDRHRMICDHEAEFMAEILEESGPTLYMRKSGLYRRYREWMLESGYHPVGQNKFNSAVKSYFPNVSEARLRTPDTLVWLGIKWRGSVESEIPSMQG